MDVFHEAVVLPEWIDINGHMNLAYYVVIFDHATDALFRALGVSDDYRAAGASLFVVETHTRYLRELSVGEPVRVQAILLDADAKRLHFAHVMRHAEHGFEAATQELLSVHVDMETRRSAPFPPDRSAAFAAALTPPPVRPDWVGRRIGMGR